MSKFFDIGRASNLAQGRKPRVSSPGRIHLLDHALVRVLQVSDVVFLFVRTFILWTVLPLSIQS